MSETPKTHPDDLVALLSNLAREHGYGIESIDLIGMHLVGGDVPRHRYGAEVITERTFGGQNFVGTTPMQPS